MKKNGAGCAMPEAARRWTRRRRGAALCARLREDGT